MAKYIGIDLGALSINTILYDSKNQGIEELPYLLHQREPLPRAIINLKKILKDEKGIEGIGVTGSGGELLASLINAHFVNPIIAQAEANIRLYPHLRTIFTIGGQSSGLIFLDHDSNPDQTVMSDSVTSGQCAAGTGSFLDQAASRLKYSIEEFSDLALKSKTPENISGTCSVFANSAMINSQQNGAKDVDIIAGLCYGLARNLIGTLSRGKRLSKPISLQGGVAANRGMIKAFEDILGLLKENETLFIPPYFRSMDAIGAAMIAARQKQGRDFNLKVINRKLRSLNQERKENLLKPLSLTDDINILEGDLYPSTKDERWDVFLGIDVGSISTNIAVLNFAKGEWKLLTKRYLPTESRPLKVVTQALLDVEQEMGERINVLDVCVTGSGRGLVADYLGGVRTRNEITAHKTGSLSVAERLEIGVDEIFEIGGQDSKYIILEDGVVVDFAMNTACAAGTGSFIEEQAKLLGIRVEDFAHQAFKSQRPFSFGSCKCTVFMEQEVISRQNTHRKNDLVASLCHAIAHNYLNEFKIGDKRGKNIFLQGGVALNRAVVVALQYLTKAKITVPPHCEVLGAIGAAILAKKMYQGKTNFVGFKRLKGRTYSLKSFECKGCANVCTVKMVEIEEEEGITYYYGDRCQKYQKSAGQLSIENNLPNLFRERERLLTRPHETKTKRNGIKIGIPRLFSVYYDLFPLWQAFFTELGYRVITSEITNKKLLAKGSDGVLSDTCLPLEMLTGHIRNLLEKDVDYIFLPSVIEMPNRREDRKTYLCPLVQASPYMARVTTELGKKLLTVPIHFHKKRYNLERAMMEIGRTLGQNPKSVKRALSKGLASFTHFNKEIKKRGREILENIENYSLPVVVVSRSYTIGDPGINVDLPRMLLDLDALPIPLDFLPLEEQDLGTYQGKINWSYGQRILRAAELIRKTPRLNAVYFSIFACGPDSFLTTFFKNRMGGKPFLNLEVGKTTAQAHLRTRCEAFLDSVRERVEKIHQLSFKSKEVSSSPKPGKRKLLIPYMDEDAHILVEALKFIGVEAELLPRSSDATLTLANRFISDKTCLPTRETAGDFLGYVLRHPCHPDKIAFFNMQADGSCRQKCYYLLQEQTLKELGFEVPIITPEPGTINYWKGFELVNGRIKISKIRGFRFLTRFWKGLVAMEVIRQYVRERRPYELVPGSIDRAFKENMNLILEGMREGNMASRTYKLFQLIEKVPIGRKEEKVNIGVVGEAYVRVHEHSNEYMVKRIESLGGIVILPMTGSFLNYAFEVIAKRHPILKPLKYLQEFLEHQVTKKIRHHLIFPEPKAKEMLAAASHYLHLSADSEALEGTGLARLYIASRKIYGILSPVPSYCMPGGILQYMLEKMHREFKIPVLTLRMDGVHDPNTRTNLEIFMHKAKRYKMHLEKK